MKRRINNILIVDDETNVLTALRRMLHREPYKIHTAGNAEEALAILRDTEMSLVISDYRMPETDGVTFLQQAKELQPDSVRIILSGFADIAAIIDAVNRGEIFKFVAKPWNDDELKMTISQSLEHWELMKRNRELSRELLIKNKELQELNDHLEAEVARRSRDLFLKDRRYLLSQFIVEHSPVPLMGVDESGMIAMANRHTSEICGKSGGALMGMSCDQVFNPSLTSQIRELQDAGAPAELLVELEGREYILHYVPVRTVSLSGSFLLAFVAREASFASTESQN